MAVWAFLVCGAADLYCSSDLVAADIPLSRETFPAGAGHGSPWKGVIHPAVSIGSTGLSDQARVFAVTTEAGKLAWAVNISLAARIRRRGNLGAGHAIGISCVTSAAGTIATVVSCAAVCILSAVTGIPAFLVPTGQVIRTVIIHKTLVRFAVDKRVPLVILWTIALRPMVPGLAKSIQSTVLIETRVLALSADAGLVIRALMVALAARLSADSVGITLKASAAGAHCPVVLDLALSIGTTSKGRARVLATFLDACKVQGTFRIRRAFRSWRWAAAHLWRTNVAIRTCTDGLVVFDPTSCQRCTWVAHSTWIDALCVLACSIIRAFSIPRATGLNCLRGWWERLSAFHIGVPPFVSRLALATRHMVAGHTFCIQATGLESTCILTTSLVTDLWVTTFIMLGALGLDLNLLAVALTHSHKAKWT